MKLKKYLLTEERADYSTQHLQDAIRHIRNGIEDIYELFDDIEDKKGMIQANKMKKEWKALEKMAKPFVYNMDKIHQFRDELKNGGPITKPVEEPAEEPTKEPIEKTIDKHLAEGVTDRGYKQQTHDFSGEELDASYLQDSIRGINDGIFDIFEFFAEVQDTQGTKEISKLRKQWNKIEKKVKSYAHNLK